MYQENIFLVWIVIICSSNLVSCDHYESEVVYQESSPKIVYDDNIVAEDNTVELYEYSPSVVYQDNIVAESSPNVVYPDNIVAESSFVFPDNIVAEDNSVETYNSSPENQSNIQYFVSQQTGDLAQQYASAFENEPTYNQQGYSTNSVENNYIQYGTDSQYQQEQYQSNQYQYPPEQYQYLPEQHQYQQTQYQYQANQYQQQQYPVAQSRIDTGMESMGSKVRNFVESMKHMVRSFINRLESKSRSDDDKKFGVLEVLTVTTLIIGTVLAI